ncbi:hypothetical protein ACHHYP_13256 [Achlya hypogyna]|uniref:Uncharacterized protein n=1 Tax=Achlya hypogyna TaxID=1202772 RepID=A0A1V9YFM8_ACHHY|nr:hypothetical protein ACHHYP_13256 [Achlya hypogyna]
MNRIVPGAGPGPMHDSGRWPVQAKLRVAVGYMSMAFSLGSGLWYLSLLAPVLANDLWWPNYNASGYEGFVTDSLNQLLQTAIEPSLAVLAPEASVTKEYSATPTVVAVHTTYARAVLLGNLTSIEFAIGNLRNMVASDTLWIGTQYCWVDFNQTFPVAHTPARQARCAQRYASNGASYLEAVLRNTDWDKFQRRVGGPDGIFTVGIQRGLEASSAGQDWIAATAAALPTHSMADEAAYWRRYGIDRFEMMWQNGGDTGVQEVVTVTNALGMAQDVVVKDVPFRLGAWTSMYLYWFFYNDLYYLQLCNMSFISSAPNYFLTAPNCSLSTTGDFEGFLGLNNDGDTYVNQTGLVHDLIGPFLTIDAFYLAVPSSLRELFILFRRSVPTDDSALPTMRVDPVPPQWTGPAMRYYGGNPLCLFGAAQTFVQPSIGFYDLCESQEMLVLTLTPDALLFALAATMVSNLTVDIDGICALQTRAPECQSVLRAGMAVLPPNSEAFAGVVARTTADVVTMGIGIMQFATNDGNWTLLQAPLLQASSLHSFYGWVYLFEWVQGLREGLSLEGDVATLPLLSTTNAPYTVVSTGGTLPQASIFVLYAVYYSSAVLIAVGGAALLLGAVAHWDVTSANLLMFHRLAGAVWVGRPLMMLRGLTALLVLSSAEVALVYDGRAHLVPVRRPFAQTVLLAGEATWITYVLGDVFLLVSRDAVVSGPVGGYVAWVALVAVASACPVPLSGAIHRQCSVTSIDHLVQCHSATIAYGSVARLGLLVSVQGVVVVGVVPVVALLRRRWQHRSAPSFHETHVSLSGVANALLSARVHGTVVALDRVACLVSGLLPSFQPHCVFNVPLWAFQHHAPGQTLRYLWLPPPTLCVRRALGSASSALLPLWRQRLRRVFAVVGAGYMLVSIGGSVSYLSVSRTHLGNDLFWTEFNMTGIHLFLTKYLVQLRVLGCDSRGCPTTLHRPGINAFGPFDPSVSSSIHVPANLASHQQRLLAADLASVVRGLRRTDACHAQWIATAYCYVDFSRRWEMANSAARQARCGTMTSNAAVVLESVLRNVAWTHEDRCWGAAFDVAIASALAETNAGRTWLSEVRGPLMPVANEVRYWRDHNISIYSTQWQNYKTIGLLLSYNVVNAYGRRFLFALQTTNGSYRIQYQTSFKMYWGLANDLTAVSANVTLGLAGGSLVRSSPAFAFTNSSTLGSVLVHSGLLPSPLGDGLTAVQTLLGPFGSIDLVYVPVPTTVAELVRSILDAIAVARVVSAEATAAFASLNSQISYNYLPLPAPWAAIDFISLGGSPLCECTLRRAGSKLISGVTQFFLSDAACAKSPIQSTVAPTPDGHVLAVLLARADNWTHVCNLLAGGRSNCVTSTAIAQMFINATGLAVPSSVDEAVVTLRSLRINLLQYGVRTEDDPVEIFLYELFAEDEDTFALFGWWYVIDWILGYRDVVSFQGDSGSATLLSDYGLSLEAAVDRSQLPTTFVAYATTGVQYVTSVTIGIATLAGVYILRDRGAVEGRNLLSLHSVGSVVWIGRPLLLLRSLTAISILATATLALDYSGTFSAFTTKSNPWYTTFLASSEVTWLSAISIDLFIVFTKELTPFFTLVNTTLVCATTTFLSFVYPPQHALAITGTDGCTMAQLDWQLECVAATVTIGHLSRTLLLAAIVASAHGLCYAGARMVKGPLPPTGLQSHFLTSGATYLFSHAYWVHDDVCYLDRASAAYNGMLSFRVGRAMHVFDLKTWRTYTIALLPAADTPAHLRHALPLTD